MITTKILITIINLQFENLRLKFFLTFSAELNFLASFSALISRSHLAMNSGCSVLAAFFCKDTASLASTVTFISLACSSHSHITFPLDRRHLQNTKDDGWIGDVSNKNRYCHCWTLNPNPQTCKSSFLLIKLKCCLLARNSRINAT